MLNSNDLDVAVKMKGKTKMKSFCCREVQSGTCHLKEKVW